MILLFVIGLILILRALTQSHDSSPDP
jgi:hypothetical protein